MTIEQGLFWVAVVLYGVSAFGYVFGFIARGEKLLSAGFLAASAGFVAHTISIGVRWTSGSTPFISTAESLSLGVWASLLVFLGVQLRSRALRALGVLVMPVAFVLIGWSAQLRAAPASELVPALQSGWLWVHIVGASTGFSCVLVAAGLGFLFLLRQDRQGGLYDRMPAPAALDDLSYRFVAAGFTMYGVMLVSGAFWADTVKGTFWNWDPVEVWSLVSWLVYGIYLHLRVTFGWRGKRLAIYALVAMGAMILSYWGIPFTIDSFHSGFRIEH